MGRKKSFLGQAVVGLGKLVGWTIIGVFKLAWWLVKGVGKGIGAGFSAATTKAKEAREKAKARHDETKIPASYSPLVVAQVVKGDPGVFESRLLKESMIVAIAGRRGSGKSGLGFRLLENIRAKARRPCFVLGVKQSVLPGWIKSIEDIHDVENGGVVLVDEGAIVFGSREAMSKRNRALGELLAIARHKDLTLLFIIQNTGMIDKNVLNLCDAVVLKEGSLLQEKMERSAMKELYETANKALNVIPASSRKAYCYIFDAEFEGLVQATLPSFWSTSISKSRA